MQQRRGWNGCAENHNSRTTLEVKREKSSEGLWFRGWCLETYSEAYLPIPLYRPPRIWLALYLALINNIQKK